jgi:hypothetical protein
MTEGKVIPFAGSLRGRFIPSLRHSDWMARSTILLRTDLKLRLLEMILRRMCLSKSIG